MLFNIRNQEMIAARVKKILARIEQARTQAVRDDEVLLLGVSKKVSLEAMKEALVAGVVAFGESYVQEALPKIDQLGDRVRFDLIGPLQTNKVKYVVGRFHLIHSVDRISLAREISKMAIKSNIIQKVLLQVNISEETTKSGVLMHELSELCGNILLLPNLSVEGLMTIGSSTEAGRDIQCREFRRLREIKEELEARYKVKLPQLSMGMSEDFELAIAEGATIVRIGSGIFGERENYE